ncbi:hypothetical protein [Tenacibaculum dicentrarchi]|uniref:hypothetical protein n=1 Tax=Tenacibaculum dicentrarchi TaxID=669041 RepID=UPI001BE9F96E
MGIITLRDYPNQKLEFTLPKVEEDPVKVKIHMVRVYNDDTTILSVICLTIKNKHHYYTSITREGTSPAREGDYYGYLITRRDGGTSTRKVDSKEMKKDIDNTLSKLQKFDERLPKIYQKGSDTKNHNGLRIYQPNLKGGGKIRKGGNRFFHRGTFYRHTIGCELLGTTAKFDEGIDTSRGRENENIEDIYRIRNTSIATHDFINNILNVYKENVLNSVQSRVEIDIRVDFNLVQKLSKKSIINPGEEYRKLYPYKKVEVIKVNSQPIKINK